MDNSNSLSLNQAEVIVVGGTPGGIMTAIAAARRGHSAIILERTAHVGGLPANGLGATDISTRGVAAGLFKEFTSRLRAYYLDTYGPDSEQVQICSDGYHFEPSKAEMILNEMLDECPSVTVLTHRQFDAKADNVVKEGREIRSIRVTNRQTGETEVYAGNIFADATYEGDLAAAAGVPFSTRREGFSDYHEPMAGRVFQRWSHPDEIGEGSTFEGDDTIQAYNFRLCLTNRPENRVPIPKPPGYDREEYASLAEDLRLDRMPGVHVREREWDGIGRITNIVWLPNGKTDANNQHLAFISTDLPVENYPWPTADWAWRDQFQERLKNYTLGLFWFLQNDPEVPQSFQENARHFGLAADEYQDNGNFPRQVYVREGRRIEGEVCFLAHDAIPVAPGARPPVHATSVAASHYPVDSHAVRKREEGRAHLDGFVSVHTAPYTVPYGVMVPKTMDNLLVPVAVSASHMGFGTLRMEPCWMALGEAAGAAAHLMMTFSLPSRQVPIEHLQLDLVCHGAQIIHYKDISPSDPLFPALQILGARGGLTDWNARLDDPSDVIEASRWASLLRVEDLDFPDDATRREIIEALWSLYLGKAGLRISKKDNHFQMSHNAAPLCG